MPKKIGTMHVYGSSHRHDDVWIVGDRQGLAALRDAITRALNDDRPDGALVTATDGEGFMALVVPFDEDALKKLALPYGATWLENGADCGLQHPFSLTVDDRYREIVEFSEQPPPANTRYQFAQEVSKEALAGLFSETDLPQLNCSFPEHILRQLALRHMQLVREPNELVRTAIIGSDD